uniref:Variant surface glycoprotein 1125.254 n=1 Tax=Trypanosoma brucei TaxID=5691 RepID=A0A1J0R5I7_9TRYP|nr:variant surface glycoprotein 1125.254 [Trypanosoma brucei]
MRWMNRYPRSKQAADIVGGANRAEKAAICNIIALTDSEIKIPAILLLTDDDYQFIQALNFSVSTPAWKSLVYKGKDTKAVHDTPKEAQKTGLGCEGFLNDWKKATQRITTDPMKEKVKASGTMALTEQRLIIARKAPSDAASEIQILRKLYSTNSRPTKAITNQELAKTLNTAVYGADTKPSPNPARNTVFGGESSGNREALCTVAAGTSKAATVLTTLACLCNKGTNAVDTPVCSKGGNGADAWEGSTGAGTNPSDTELKTIAESCSDMKGTKITHHELSRRVEAVTKLIHVESTAGYLGTFVSSDCNGSSGNSVCVKFPNFNTNAEQALQNLKWIHDLTDLVATLKDMENKKTVAEKILIQIKAAAEKANASIKHAAASAQAISIHQAKDPSQAKPVEEQNKFKTKNTTVGECPGKHCDYDRKKEECKPKVGEDTTAAKRGDQTGKKCSDYGNKQECEKANDEIPEGQPRKCGWIGKDKSGGDKGFKRCDSDSSSIRN